MKKKKFKPHPLPRPDYSRETINVATIIFKDRAVEFDKLAEKHKLSRVELLRQLIYQVFEWDETELTHYRGQYKSVDYVKNES